ncbi:MAG TPA: hypothetical protein VEO55_04135, partial [Candidatus Dormibacteraeota bacterium]|nr:hypothetical protein [Candidatus Dormibacteraeota bacterium]
SRSLSRPAPIPPADVDLALRIARSKSAYRQFFPASACSIIRIGTQFYDTAFFRNKYLQIIAQAVTLTLVNFGVVLARSENCYSNYSIRGLAGCGELG